ncbi:MAG: hypothetical protein NT129_06580 [Candidatus Aenigmarchaeota archaeon]|nr:hypothetical protein [Candidatus Aenigmarchaeota archaeon]
MKYKPNDLSLLRYWKKLLDSLSSQLYSIATEQRNFFSICDKSELIRDAAQRMRLRRSDILLLLRYLENQGILKQATRTKKIKIHDNASVRKN